MLCRAIIAARAACLVHLVTLASVAIFAPGLESGDLSVKAHSFPHRFFTCLWSADGLVRQFLYGLRKPLNHVRHDYVDELDEVCLIGSGRHVSLPNLTAQVKPEVPQNIWAQELGQAQLGVKHGSGASGDGAVGGLRGHGQGDNTWRKTKTMYR